jgi:hypothetical protein
MTLLEGYERSLVDESGVFPCRYHSAMVLHAHTSPGDEQQTHGWPPFRDVVSTLRHDHHQETIHRLQRLIRHLLNAIYQGRWSEPGGGGDCMVSSVARCKSDRYFLVEAIKKSTFTQSLPGLSKASSKDVKQLRQQSMPTCYGVFT